MAGNHEQGQKLSQLLPLNNWARSFSSLIIDQLIKNGVDQFYVAPGMRNSPLIAAATRHPNATIYYSMDERSLSYRALGHTKASGRGVALICTSGTAVANFFPAILEAQKTNLPMMVISADRPTELTLSDANQTLRQSEIFTHRIKESASFEAPHAGIVPSFASSIVAQLCYQMNRRPMGVTHLNVSFREPLDEGIEFVDPQWIEDITSVIDSNQSTNSHYQIENLQTNLPKEVVRLIQEAKRPLLVAGQLEGPDEKAALKRILKKWKGLLYLDIGTGLKFSYNTQDGAIPSLDHPEVHLQLDRKTPDLILHLGGRTVSKHYYNLLKSHDQIQLITVEDSDQNKNPAHRKATHLKCSLDSFEKSFIEDSIPLKVDENYISELKAVSSKLVEKKIAVIDQSKLSFPWLTRHFVSSLKDQSIDFVTIANSTIVRSFDSWQSLEDRAKVDTITHRGASGIEGFLSSAIGTLDYRNEQTGILFVGDVSFLHDLNALEMLSRAKGNLRIYLLNNGGGGIFSLLPISNDQKTFPYLYTEQNVNFDLLSQAFGIEFQKVTSKEQMSKLLGTKPSGVEIVEVLIDNDENCQLYDKLKTIKL